MRGNGLVIAADSLIAATVLGINLMGDALRDALDPKVAKAI